MKIYSRAREWVLANELLAVVIVLFIICWSFGIAITANYFDQNFVVYSFFVPILPIAVTLFSTIGYTVFVLGIILFLILGYDFWLKGDYPNNRRK